ncbi:hypothetical protein [Mammaliicoccus sp. Dog046]|uniref:hypothetical protein n=1 Tax=Mammaliicoccus sp. Dog046 TaxID=3034233 RepID=UPI002B25B410|nr:hypothetical protein [Mammaliicoccus sp. Dog046]WQK86632.1 hypothetical protein P3U32_06350 [Mammaliicoccus sp. Dog046]
MKKIFFTILTGTVILSACGNDKVQQLEQKKSSLKSENSKVKKEVLDLEDKNKTYKQKETSTQSSIDHLKDESKAQFATEYLKSSTQFVNDTKTNIASYNKIHHQLQTKFDDTHTKSELENIVNSQKDATQQYKDSLKDKTIPKKYKDLHKNMLKLTDDFESVFKELQQSYDKKDKTAVKKAMDKLKGLNTEISQIM